VNVNRHPKAALSAAAVSSFQRMRRDGIVLVFAISGFIVRIKLFESVLIFPRLSPESLVNFLCLVGKVKSERERIGRVCKSTNAFGGHTFSKAWA